MISLWFGKYRAFTAFLFLRKKVKENIYLSAANLFRRLDISTCQTTNSYAFIHCFHTYEPNVHYNSSYLSIDSLKKGENE